MGEGSQKMNFRLSVISKSWDAVHSMVTIVNTALYILKLLGE